MIQSLYQRIMLDIINRVCPGPPDWYLNAAACHTVLHHAKCYPSVSGTLHTSATCLSLSKFEKKGNVVEEEV